MRTAVAIYAGGRLGVASLHGLPVETAIISRLLVGVASGAGDFEGRSLVRGILNVGMAVHTREHAAVDGIFEALGTYMQADGLAIHVMGQRGIAMAGQAFFRNRLRRLLAGCWLSRREDSTGG